MAKDVLSDEELDALFTRWRTMPAVERDEEQERLRNSLSREGRAAWIRRVELRTLAGLQAIADRELAALKGKDRPLWWKGPDGKPEMVNDSAIDGWIGLKEGLVREAARVRRR